VCESVLHVDQVGLVLVQDERDSGRDDVAVLVDCVAREGSVELARRLDLALNPSRGLPGNGQRSYWLGPEEQRIVANALRDFSSVGRLSGVLIDLQRMLATPQRARRRRRRGY
jgi:hypothetical protein